MYGGLATPTEAAALGAFGSLVIPIALRRMGKKDFSAAVVSAMKSTTMIFTIIIGAMIFGYFLTITESTQHLIGYIGGLEVNRWFILIAIDPSPWTISSGCAAPFGTAGRMTRGSSSIGTRVSACGVST